MKRLFAFIFLFFPLIFKAQNIAVDSQTYTPQQLIEDILIANSCISNVVVTNVVGGNFTNDKSYGFFDATGTTFPIQKGIVLSTGKLSNVKGPNTFISSDNAPGWIGDTDLEAALNESNTHNATIIEFDFVSKTNQISFRYLFASEEYQQNNANTCKYSDLFGFLIRPANQQQYTNIALIPNTQTPVKVTTVHPLIPNGCAAINEEYFGSFNGTVSPINFNGQTKVLTATATVNPNEVYHVKLVIADETNALYDSAVFLEAGSFQMNVDLGKDRLLASNNPLCENESYTLNAFIEGPNNTYKWFKNGVEIENETNANYTISAAGTYTVEVDLGNNCMAFGGITIEYTLKPGVNNSTLTACDENQDGKAVFNLKDAAQTMLNNDSNLRITNFFYSLNDAILNANSIVNPSAFENSTPSQTVYARVENQYACFAVAVINLEFKPLTTINIQPFEVCDNLPIDGFSDFNLNDLRSLIKTQLTSNTSVKFYKKFDDASNSTNEIDGNYTNSKSNNEVIYTKITDGNLCIPITPISLKVLHAPKLDVNEELYYCLNTFPNTLAINSGLLNVLPKETYTYQWLKDGVDLNMNSSTININELGTYKVTVSSANNCSNSREIVVKPSNSATIIEIVVKDLTENNSITVIVTGEGDYEYGLDNQNGNFQESNEFFNVENGYHTVFIKDKNGCNTVQQQVSVVGFINYFTPNNDGYNDYWKPFTKNYPYNSKLEIYIYDRFGKLLIKLNPMGLGWDGTIKGTQLPSGNYWFKAIQEDGKVYKGHFSLKR